MKMVSIVTTGALCALILVGLTVHVSKPWLPNILGYEELGWVHRGSMTLAGDVVGVRKWTGLTGLHSRMPWPIDHYKLKLKKGQQIELQLSGKVEHGKVTAGIAKRSGYFLHPMETQQITNGKYVRLRPEDNTPKTLIYEIEQDGYYHISITPIGKFKGFKNPFSMVKTDMLYDVRWRLI